MRLKQGAVHEDDAELPESIQKEGVCIVRARILHRTSDPPCRQVEGLKTELKTSRTTVGRLSKQVRGLKSITRVHLPSLVVGAIVGIGLVKLFEALKRRKSDKAAEVTVEAEAEEDDNEEVKDQGAEENEAETATA